MENFPKPEIKEQHIKKKQAKPNPIEEENKADIVFASSKNCSPNGLEANASIYGGKSVKTIFIQDAPPQNKEMKLNQHSKVDAFKEFSPFVTFPNIIDKNSCSGPTSNAFFDAFFLAYTFHGEIVLSPDDIWLQINSCFAQYVNKFPEELRDMIVTFKNKKDLVVLYNEEDPNFQNMRHNSFRWDIIVNNFSELIEKNTLQNLADLIQCNFSTSGAIEKIASQVSLMHSCEKYFNYGMLEICCGIQKVHFLGEEKDWTNLKEKLVKLKKYELPGQKEYVKWIERLENVIDNFIKTYRNEPDLKFWNSIIQQFEGYELKIGGSGMKYYGLSQFVNGWILNFFLLGKKDNYFVENLVDVPLEKPDSESFRRLKNNAKIGKSEKGTNFESIPMSVWKAPVLIELINGEKIPVSFLGGFTGVVNENTSYRPQISFAVADREITDEENSFEPLSKLMKDFF